MQKVNDRIGLFFDDFIWVELVIFWDGIEIHVHDVLTFHLYLKENIRHRHSKDQHFNDV